MKPIDDAFSSRGFRRVVLPGIVITVGIHPLIKAALENLMLDLGLDGSGLILVVEIIVCGLLLSSATDWVYYVYQGYRLSWLTRPAGWWNEWHLARQTKKLAALKGTKQYEELSPELQDRVSLIYEDLQDFPLRRGKGGRPERYVDRPTRIGNVIATYELYPKTRHGIDGGPFWYHLLACAPDSARQDFDDQYAFAESLVLTSFAGLIVSLVNASILVVRLVATRCGDCALASIQITAAHPVASLLLGLAVCFVFYRLALPVQREAGKMFRALTDLGISKFLCWVNKPSVPPDESVVKKARFLRDYLDNLKTHGEPPTV